MLKAIARIVGEEIQRKNKSTPPSKINFVKAGEKVKPEARKTGGFLLRQEIGTYKLTWENS